MDYARNCAASSPGLKTPHLAQAGITDQSTERPPHPSSSANFRTAARVRGDTRKRLAWSRSICSLTLGTRPTRLAFMSRPRVPITGIRRWSATLLARPSSNTTTTSSISPASMRTSVSPGPKLWSSGRVELPVGGRIVSHSSALTSGKSIPQALPSSISCRTAGGMRTRPARAGRIWRSPS